MKIAIVLTIVSELTNIYCIRKRSFETNECSKRTKTLFCRILLKMWFRGYSFSNETKTNDLVVCDSVGECGKTDINKNDDKKRKID